MKKIFIFLFFLTGVCLAANNGHYHDTAQALSQNGALVALPRALVTVCTDSSNCSNTTVNLCSSLTDSVCNQSGAFFADVQGNFAFYVAPGTYQIQIQKVGYSTYFLNDVIINASSASGLADPGS